MIREDLREQAVEVADRLVRHFEGCRLSTYRDAAGVLTIGYGHTRTAREGETISHRTAEGLLRIDLWKASDHVISMTSWACGIHQHAALVSFVFNVGQRAYARSALRRRLNSGDTFGVAEELPKWRRAGGRVLRGLLRRREAEQRLWLTPDDVPFTIDGGAPPCA